MKGDETQKGIPPIVLHTNPEIPVLTRKDILLSGHLEEPGHDTTSAGGRHRLELNHLRLEVGHPSGLSEAWEARGGGHRLVERGRPLGRLEHRGDLKHIPFREQ